MLDSSPEDEDFPGRLLHQVIINNEVEDFQFYFRILIGRPMG